MCKKLSLDEAIDLCIEAWTKIVEEYKKGEKDIYKLKLSHIPKNVKAHCYFCEYASQRAEKPDVPLRCIDCPLNVLKKGLRCMNESIDYKRKPEVFLKTLLKLKKKRENTRDSKRNT